MLLKIKWLVFNLTISTFYIVIPIYSSITKKGHRFARKFALQAMKHLPCKDTSALVLALFFSRSGCSVRWHRAALASPRFPASDRISSTLAILTTPRGVFFIWLRISFHRFSHFKAFFSMTKEHQVEAHVSMVNMADSSKRSTSPIDATMDLVTRIYSASP